MKQPVQSPEPGASASSSLGGGFSRVQIPDFHLSVAQRQVLECLNSSAEGMTLRQLEAALKLPADELGEAIDYLVESGLVACLNTIIPSYVSRYPGLLVYD